MERRKTLVRGDNEDRGKQPNIPRLFGSILGRIAEPHLVVRSTFDDIEDPPI